MLGGCLHGRSVGFHLLPTEMLGGATTIDKKKLEITLDESAFCALAIIFAFFIIILFFFNVFDKAPTHE